MSRSNQVTLSPDPFGGNKLHAPLNYTWQATKERKEDFGRFQAISVLTTLSNEQSTDLDIFDRLALVSKPANRLFIELKKRRDFNNSLVIYDPACPSKSAKVLFSRWLSSLKQQEIVKKVPVSNNYIKVRKHTYMLNPRLIKCKNYSDAVLLWGNL